MSAQSSLPRPPAQNVLLFRVPLAQTTMDQVLDLVHASIVSRRPLQVGVVNAAKLIGMQKDRTLREDVLGSGIILADGHAVVWASRMLKRPLPQRIAGIDLMMEMLKRGHREGYRFFLLGAAEDVSAAVAERIAREYPGAHIVGRRNGFFSHEEEPKIVQAILDAAPDILLVAMSSPKKERFMARWGLRLRVPVSHGVGGSFDVLAGKVRRAPAAWQRLGLEWLFRLKQEPRRLLRRYLLTNTLFALLLLKEMGRARRRRPRPLIRSFREGR
jgi:N-acetylglucosaminyldiphosphoundecaprenol N-acetyl-beta-D-mannosaminyltransferase